MQAVISIGPSDAHKLRVKRSSTTARILTPEFGVNTRQLLYTKFVPLTPGIFRERAAEP